LIDVMIADITTLDVSVVVNAANETLLGGGGVDGAIHRAAGPELKTYCAQLGGCRTGEARLTPGFGLVSAWIVHTVGPVWKGGSAGEAALLQCCYENCFALAMNAGLASIAFPAISTGVFGYPKLDAAAIAVSVMRQHQVQFERIVACCFSESDAQDYRVLLADSCA
jgi:O-acetyl-ADP-ribose deacetylase (regulator of RNase III)